MADIRMSMIGSYESIIKALASGKLKPDTYVYVKDKEILAWIDLDGMLHLLGDSVQQVTEFPTKGSRNALYIKGITPYIWDGTEYINLNKELTLKIEQIEKQLEGLNDPTTGEPVNVITYVSESVKPVETAVENIQKNGAAIMITSNGGDE